MAPIVVASRPVEVFSKAYSYNPRLRSRAPRAQDQLLEEFLGDQIAMKMLTALSGPIAFAVPDGCNAVELFVDPIEHNPNVGCVDDLELVVTTGPIRLSDNALVESGPLQAGDQITVTIPWRYASWIELAPDHLRVELTARFFSIDN